MKIVKLYGIGILSLCATAMFAQAPAPAAAPAPAPAAQTAAHHRTINQRKENQQDRIAQGVKSGQLTAGETGNLERREASINREEHNMRKADDGHLTKADRHKLNRRQNRVSHSIYRDKHNGRRQ